MRCLRKPMRRLSPLRRPPPSPFLSQLIPLAFFIIIFYYQPALMVKAQSNYNPIGSPISGNYPPVVRHPGTCTYQRSQPACTFSLLCYLAGGVPIEGCGGDISVTCCILNKSLHYTTRSPVINRPYQRSLLPLPPQGSPPGPPPAPYQGVHSSRDPSRGNHQIQVIPRSPSIQELKPVYPGAGPPSVSLYHTQNQPLSPSHHSQPHIPPSPLPPPSSGRLVVQFRPPTGVRYQPKPSINSVYRPPVATHGFAPIQYRPKQLNPVYNGINNGPSVRRIPTIPLPQQPQQPAQQPPPPPPPQQNKPIETQNNVYTYPSLMKRIKPNQVAQNRNSSGRKVTAMDEICGKPAAKPTSRIIGGQDAYFGEFPWQVHIKIAKHQCGGALINQNFIITAAHCIYQAPLEQLTVVIGAHDIEDQRYQDEPAQYFKVKEVRMHPKFRFSSSHPDRFDIAVVRLDKPVRFRNNVLPVCLPPPQFNFEGWFGMVTGWGKTNPTLSNRYGTRLLQKVQVPIINNVICEKWHRTRGIDLNIFDEMMCAGYEDGKKDACVGDSGGPLVVFLNGRWTLAGITSAGFGCAQSRQPGIYHRVSDTVTWVLTNIQ